ncbi:hypothetical protein GWO13_01240 [Candidatus Bathyarchaeota archaeon]|nr:hypothetical protein [Candidatus Bathyarchaeota archaeon]
MAMADEAYAKRCHFCGKKIEKPVLYKGYVFCSTKCRESFISGGKKTRE